MTWETFYATCFVVGLLLSAVSFLAGAVHLHIPGLHLHVHMHPAGVHGHAAGTSHGGRGGSYFNFATLTAFLAWFGGTGFLLTRYSNLWMLLALLFATISGLVGSTLVFLFLVKVLLAHEQELNPLDYEMIGVLGRVSSTIRQGGVGEVIYSQEGVRRAVSARSEDGKPISRGTEVVVTQYERGVAYVRAWDEINELDSASASPQR